MENPQFLHLPDIILKTMAELNSSAGSLRGGSRTKTLSPRVDMTPMVDLMFLLITFFMLTTTLAKPVAMSLAMPVESPNRAEIADSRTINICLGENNQMLWYMGNAEKPLTTPEKANFAKSGIRKILHDKNMAAIKATGNSSKGLIAIIKPGNKSTYKNLVDLLDEMEIIGISTYYIVDIVKSDIKKMQENNIH